MPKPMPSLGYLEAPIARHAPLGPPHRMPTLRAKFLFASALLNVNRFFQGNVPTFGTDDPMGADFRACANLGPLY